MIKHIKTHSHAFLFFLGGLFLMLVGPSLIPFSSAATMSATESVVYRADATEKSVVLYAPNAKSNSFSLSLKQLGVDTTLVKSATLQRKTLKGNNLEYKLQSYIAKSDTVKVGFGTQAIGIYNPDNMSDYYLILKDDKGNQLAKVALEVYTKQTAFTAAKSRLEAEIKRGDLSVEVAPGYATDTTYREIDDNTFMSNNSYYLRVAAKEQMSVTIQVPNTARQMALRSAEKAPLADVAKMLQQLRENAVQTINFSLTEDNANTFVVKKNAQYILSFKDSKGLKVGVQYALYFLDDQNFEAAKQLVLEQHAAAKDTVLEKPCDMYDIKSCPTRCAKINGSCQTKPTKSIEDSDSIYVAVGQKQNTTKSVTDSGKGFAVVADEIRKSAGSITSIQLRDLTSELRQQKVSIDTLTDEKSETVIQQFAKFFSTAFDVISSNIISLVESIKSIKNDMSIMRSEIEALQLDNIYLKTKMALLLEVIFITDENDCSEKPVCRESKSDLEMLDVNYQKMQQNMTVGNYYKTSAEMVTALTQGMSARTKSLISKSHGSASNSNQLQTNLDK